MKKILIAIIDDDKFYANEVAVYLKQQKYVSNVVIAYDGISGFNLTTTMHPDVVILDSVMPNLDGIGYMMQLNKCDLNYKPKIILKCHVGTESYVRKVCKYGATSIIKYKDKPKKIHEEILSILGKKDKKPKKSNKQNEATENTDFVMKVMSLLGITINLVGYKYIMKSLQYAISDISITYSVTRSLYPIIAKEFNVSPASVERSMRTAICISWQKGNRQVLTNIFGMKANELKRPTNTEYIATIANDIRIKMKQRLG